MSDSLKSNTSKELDKQLRLKVTKNSKKFRGPALHYRKYECYTFAPQGTTEYIKYWTQEMDRCLYGYVAEDGDRIPGFFYFYLNYFPIDLVAQVEVTLPNGKVEMRPQKKKDLPEFYDYDRYFFEAVEEAERRGKHLVVIKARRKGYSYKIASMLVRNYYFIRGSKGFALASEAEYLVKDGILSKAWDAMDFIDGETAWFKKRQKADTRMHRRASYVQKDSTGVAVELGYKSEIMGVTLKNDSDKARGKAGKLIIFEEAGKFPGLLEAWQKARPSVEQGSYVFGTLIAFGTGGTEGANYEGLKELFENPDAYNCLVFENVWDEHLRGQKCGFFVPQYANLEGKYSKTGEPFMDEDGNTIVSVAKRFILEERQKVIDNASDRRAIDRHISEMPISPAEAVLNISTNIFPKAELTRHLSEIKNNTKYSDLKQVGNLIYSADGDIIWEIDTKYRDINKYRLKPEDSREGAIVIWEHPVDDPPYGMYIMGVDPYDHDQSGTDSLGSTFVYKRFQAFEQYYDLPVAEYTGRPNTAEEYYEKVRMLAHYYNAKVMYENEKKGLFSHFAHKHQEYLLADQPDIIRDVVQDSKVQRGKGCHMNKPIKEWGEGLIKDWLNEEQSPGVKNLTKIFSEPLLEELIAYNPDSGNFDRVMAFMMIMVYQQELHHVKVKETKKQNKIELFTGGLFRDTQKRFII